jgi:hypothetical protein
MIVAMIALFVALGGTATALTGSNTVFSDDITNDEVYSADVRDDTLSGGGLAAADLRPGSVGPSETSGLTGADVANAASGSDKLNADRLDGLDSTDFLRSSSANEFVRPAWDSLYGRQGFDVADVPAGEDQPYLLGIRDLALHYKCPAVPASQNGFALIDVGTASNLFVDNGSENPDYYKVPSEGSRTQVPTAASGEALTIQVQYGRSGSADEALDTILLFSVHRPGLPGVNAGSCHVQAQIMDGANFFPPG